MVSLRCVLMSLFLVNSSAATAHGPALAATNLLLAGVKTMLNTILPPAIKLAGFDPYESDFEQQFKGPSLSVGVCKEASINAALHSMNVEGLSSAQISVLQATSATSNFFMTRVDAPTGLAAAVEDDLIIRSDGEVSATCSAGPFGSVDIAKTGVHTASHVNGVSISANVSLSLNLATSTFKSAHVDSVLVTFSSVNTSCSIDSSTFDSLQSLCPVIDSQITARLLSFFEGPLSAQMKYALQASLDSALPFGPSAKAVDASQLPDEPRRLLEEIPMAPETPVLI